jgi:hypothetical protein
LLTQLLSSQNLLKASKASMYIPSRIVIEGKSLYWVRLQFCSSVEYVGPRPQQNATSPFHNGSVDESGSLKVNSLPRMAPNPAESQHAQIRDMLLSNRPPAEIANTVGCSKRSVFAIKSNRRSFGSTKAPSNGVGRP